MRFRPWHPLPAAVPACADPRACCPPHTHPQTHTIQAWLADVVGAPATAAQLAEVMVDGVTLIHLDSDALEELGVGPDELLRVTDAIDRLRLKLAERHPSRTTNTNRDWQRVMKIHQWTVDDVLKWLAQLDLAAYADGFRQNDISGVVLTCLDGACLLQLGVDSAYDRSRILAETDRLNQTGLPPGQSPSRPGFPMSSAVSAQKLSSSRTAPPARSLPNSVRAGIQERQASPPAMGSTPQVAQTIAPARSVRSSRPNSATAAPATPTATPGRSPLGARAVGLSPRVGDWSPSDVGLWLRSELKLPQYSSAFEHNEVDGALLLELDADALRELGVGGSLHAIKIANKARRHHLTGVAEQVERRREEAAAVRVQALHRGAAARHQHKLSTAAATRVQSCWRGRFARQRQEDWRQNMLGGVLAKPIEEWNSRDVVVWVRLVMRFAAENVESFRVHEVDGMLLLCLDEPALLEMGVHSALQRLKLLSKVKTLSRPPQPHPATPASPSVNAAKVEAEANLAAKAEAKLAAARAEAEAEAEEEADAAAAAVAQAAAAAVVAQQSSDRLSGADTAHLMAEIEALRAEAAAARRQAAEAMASQLAAVQEAQAEAEAARQQAAAAYAASQTSGGVEAQLHAEIEATRAVAAAAKKQATEAVASQLAAVQEAQAEVEAARQQAAAAFAAQGSDGAQAGVETAALHAQIEVAKAEAEAAKQRAATAVKQASQAMIAMAEGEQAASAATEAAKNRSAEMIATQAAAEQAAKAEAEAARAQTREALASKVAAEQVSATVCRTGTVSATLCRL